MTLMELVDWPSDDVPEEGTVMVKHGHAGQWMLAANEPEPMPGIERVVGRFVGRKKNRATIFVHPTSEPQVVRE